MPKNRLPNSFRLHADVSHALTNGAPIVALESAVITHGLPRPTNYTLALEMEEILRQRGVTPATIALIDGKMVIGATAEELERLSQDEAAIKVNPRNIGIGISRELSGGTTVAATLFAARAAGIKVFATGGIGGVHRGNPFDVSADLNALAECPVIVVCAGAKAILDLPATVESLETRGIPVLGYQTDQFPAFYTRDSDLGVDFNAGSAKEIFEIAQSHWKSGSQRAVLVGNPIPRESEVDSGLISNAIEEARLIAERMGIHGPSLTPFLLNKLNEVTSGKSLSANIALLKNNATLAAEIAAYFGHFNLVSY